MVEIYSYILLLKNCLEKEELLRDCLNIVHGVGCCSRGDGTGFVAQQLYEEKLVRSKWELNYVWNYLNGFYCNRVQLTSFHLHNTQYTILQTYTQVGQNTQDIPNTGCPTKHVNSKTTWKSSLIFEFICDI